MWSRNFRLLGVNLEIVLHPKEYRFFFFQYEAEEKHFQALISYKRAIEVDPNSPEISTFYNNLGALLTNMNKLEESMIWYCEIPKLFFLQKFFFLLQFFVR